LNLRTKFAFAIEFSEMQCLNSMIYFVQYFFRMSSFIEIVKEYGNVAKKKMLEKKNVLIKQT